MCAQLTVAYAFAFNLQGMFKKTLFSSWIAWGSLLFFTILNLIFLYSFEMAKRWGFQGVNQSIMDLMYVSSYHPVR